jgi:hypothetical protein
VVGYVRELRASDTSGRVCVGKRREFKIGAAEIRIGQVGIGKIGSPQVGVP